MKYSTTAIILSEIDAHGQVSVVEVKYFTLPPEFVTEPGSRYGLPGPEPGSRSKEWMLKHEADLQVVMAKKRVPYRRIFPLDRSSKFAWQLEGHKLESDKLALLNKDLRESNTTASV